MCIRDSGYTNVVDDLLDRYRRQETLSFDAANDAWHDAHGMVVENFGNADNLMSDCASPGAGRLNRLSLHARRAAGAVSRALSYARNRAAHTLRVYRPTLYSRASIAASTFGGDIGRSVSRRPTARSIAFAMAAIGGQMLTSATPLAP